MFATVMHHFGFNFQNQSYPDSRPKIIYNFVSIFKRTFIALICPNYILNVNGALVNDDGTTE